MFTTAPLLNFLLGTSLSVYAMTSLIVTCFWFGQLYCMYGSTTCGFYVCTKTIIVTEHDVFYLQHTTHTTSRHHRSSRSTRLYFQTDHAGGLEPHIWLELVAMSYSSECSTWCQELTASHCRKLCISSCNSVTILISQRPQSPHFCHMKNFWPKAIITHIMC